MVGGSYHMEQCFFTVTRERCCYILTSWLKTYVIHTGKEMHGP